MHGLLRNSKGGYLNDNGVIDTKRLQVILDQMAEWEQEIFEREFSDLNWMKSKQSKHVKKMDKAKNKGGIGMCVHPSQFR
jgi:5'-3' exoribonuclease 1